MATPIPESHDSTRHTRRTTSASADYTLRTVETAPHQRSDCWRASCRAEWAGYLTVRLYLGTREPFVGSVIYVSAPCHDWTIRRPWELTDDAKSWIGGEP